MDCLSLQVEQDTPAAASSSFCVTPWDRGAIQRDSCDSQLEKVNGNQPIAFEGWKGGRGATICCNDGGSMLLHKLKIASAKMAANLELVRGMVRT